MKNSQLLCVFLSSMLAVAPLLGQTAGTLAGTPALLPPPAAVGLAQVHVIENDGGQTPAGSQSTKGITVEVSDGTGAAVADAAVTIRLPETEPTGIFADGTHSAVAYTDGSGRANINGIQWGLSPGSVSMRITATKGTSHAGVLLEKILTRPTPALAPVLPAYTAAVSNTTDMLQAIPPPPAPAFELPIAKSGASGSMPEPGTPAHPQLPNTATAQTQPPSVSVTTTGATGYQPHHSKKWVIAAVVAGAAAGGAFAAMHGKAGTPAAAVAPLSIGTPSISIGPPR
jgi:hypothetical protein